MTSPRDVLVVLLGAALVRMESEGLTVGQTVDVLIRALKSEGYTLAKKTTDDPGYRSN